MILTNNSRHLNHQTSSQSNLDQLVVELYEGINRIGLQKFIKHIQKLKIPEFNYIEDQLNTYIIHTTASHFNVKPSDMYSHYVTGGAKKAMKMCFILLHKNAGITQAVVGKMFQKNDHSLVREAIKEWSLMTNSHPDDRKFLESYVVLNEMVNKKKDQLYKINITNTENG